MLTHTVQSMLLQADGDKLYLLPVWPKGWGLSFKLHGPYKTVVECCVKDETIETLGGTPADRKKDLILGVGW